LSHSRLSRIYPSMDFFSSKQSNLFEWLTGSDNPPFDASGR
jgi:hypothetical protein